MLNHVDLVEPLLLNFNLINLNQGVDFNIIILIIILIADCLELKLPLGLFLHTLRMLLEYLFQPNVLVAWFPSQR